MDDWPTLPQLARELDIADSTARRWAASFVDVLPTTGHASTRCFHLQTREVVKRIRTLYTSGFNTEQVAEVLRHEFPATINTVAIPASDERAHERKDKDVATLQSVLVALMKQQRGMATILSWTVISQIFPFVDRSGSGFVRKISMTRRRTCP
jgi:DNA-binding transcriptional MerR regulator